MRYWEEDPVSRVNRLVRENQDAARAARRERLDKKRRKRKMMELGSLEIRYKTKVLGKDSVISGNCRNGRWEWAVVWEGADRTPQSITFEEIPIDVRQHLRTMIDSARALLMDPPVKRSA